PAAWIAVTARRRAIDRLRRERNGTRKHELLARLDASGRDDEPGGAPAFGDDRLELLFACIHPSLDLDAQIALTLRALGGLTTEEIAAAFFVECATMQQRLVRAKNKIRTAGVPFRVPPTERLDERLDAVATVIYLIFTTGYAPPRGDVPLRAELCESAIAICDVIVRLLPERAEPHALDALMRFHHARRATRADSDGEIVLLADQDRSRWDRSEIERASASLKRALARSPCSLTYEAYVAAAHAHAPSFAETDWDAIVRAYDALLLLHDTPVARCNRAVAVAMRGQLADAEAALAALGREPAMKRNRYYHVAVADVAARAGDNEAARRAYRNAITCADTRDRRLIERRLAALECDTELELTEA
ncbi:MAG: RNA polymerase subunit sigma-24, partial [Candidatus Eremiobacteraeota bacterium]|nr:RNA polymerase subunit sigma-24 [Candidatus Eremiobacteraeota bacterium]